MNLGPARSSSILVVSVFLIGCASQTPRPLAVTINPPVSAIAAGQSIQFSATVTNTFTGKTSPATDVDDANGIVWLASQGSIDGYGNYTAPATSGLTSSTAMIRAVSRADHTKIAYATIHIVIPGQVTSTPNPQVALYSISLSGASKISVQFGTDTNYGFSTNIQPVPTIGGTASVLVAGLRTNTPYHMRANVQFNDGSQFLDVDHQYIVQPSDAAPIGAQLPTITAGATPGLTPQSGVELLDLISGAAVADLNGNVLWYYSLGQTGLIPNPIKLLSNGHFLINFSQTSLDGTSSILQEIDLSNALIWQMTAADLNNALSSATCMGCNITVLGTHHDFLPLSNGHLIVIASTQRNVSGTTVTGDVLIDLDQNHKPVWLWNEFDHLDVNRRPMGFPDWTHTNAVIYSADDGNLVISVRHQSWLIKVDYENGTGDGNILWKLGYQGDFALVGGTDPTDWFYAQHGPSFTSANTTGQFSIAVLDNGDDRVFPQGVTCGTPVAPTCFYSTPEILQIDETAKTATISFNPVVPYSFFGGNVETLKNGNVEYCLSAGGMGSAGAVYEVTQDGSAQMVWQMQVTGQYVYRAQRIPSLYPGVQW
jgi:arylsulfate sulfotransferase